MAEEKEPISDMDDRDDPIAEAFFDLLSDEGMELLWDIVGEMMDAEEIEPVPGEEVSEDEQKAWLEQNMGKVRERFRELLNDGDSDSQQ